MRFHHSDNLWQDFPHLAPAVLHVAGITADARVADRAAVHIGTARARLAGATESELPEIKAWRRAFGQLGLKPTQYRCAAESLLRRLRKEGTLPSIHPLIDLCNALSVAYAIPIAVFDTDAIAGDLEVRHATGTENYLTFAGEFEHPDPGEVIFADDSGQAHARRWTNRQSGRSAIRDTTSTVLIVAEALHDTAADDIDRLRTTLVTELTQVWPVNPTTAVLTRAAPRFVSRLYS